MVESGFGSKYLTLHPLLTTATGSFPFLARSWKLSSGIWENCETRPKYVRSSEPHEGSIMAFLSSLGPGRGDSCAYVEWGQSNVFTLGWAEVLHIFGGRRLSGSLVGRFLKQIPRMVAWLEKHRKMGLSASAPGLAPKTLGCWLW